MIEARLTSTPTVTSFGSIVTNPKQAMHGDLYIAFDDSKEALELVVSKGVYGIIYQGSLMPIDNEIAWIKVDDLQRSELKLLRFHLLAQETEVFYTDIYTLEYIQQLNNDPDTVVFTQDIQTMTAMLWKLSLAKRLVAPQNDALLTLFPSAKPLNTPSETLLNELQIHAVSALEVSTRYINEQQRQKLPLVLVPHFIDALNFIEHETLVHLPKLSFISAFDVVSVNNFLEIKEFGKSNKTLLFLRDDTLVDAFCDTIAQKTPWITFELFLDQSQQKLGYNEATFYKDSTKLLTLLQSSTFDYAILPFQTQEILTQKTVYQPSLFTQGLF